MAVRVLLVLTAFALLYSCGQASSPAEKQEEREGADQALPPDPNPKPTLETAALYVAGSNGGPYKVSWSVRAPNEKALREFRGTGVIKDEPTAYPINLKGFTSDRSDASLVGDDIQIEVAKTEPWEGELVFVLEVNHTLVECKTIDKTYPRRAYIWESSIYFDADSREDYKEMAVCQNRLES
jgi:hypothetical protein